MKNYLVITATAALLITGCTDYKQQVEQLNKDKEAITAKALALQQEAINKDASIASFVETVNEIETSLNEVASKQQAISQSVSDPELKATSRQRINSTIAFIKTTMDENRAKIASLNKKLKGSNVKIKGLEEMITNLNDQLALRDQDMLKLSQRITELDATVGTLTTTCETLTADNQAKEQVITEKTTRLNTAYVAVGTYKELESHNVVKKEAGFLGLGKAKMLNADAGNNSFQSIDITKTNEIKLASADANVVTNHPSGTYAIRENTDGETSTLQITDPQKFWETSKYLVVVVDK